MNIRVTSIQTQTGVRGDGERVFSATSIVVPIPAMLSDPSSHRRSTDRSNGIESDAIITINIEAMRRQGHSVSVGDRVGYKQLRLGSVAQQGDIVDLVEKADAVEMTLGSRLDNAVVTGGA